MPLGPENEPQRKDAADYEQSKRLANHTSEALRAELASRPDVRPEILYYLAEDPSVAVRNAVAGNPATPAHAASTLAQDVDVGVRTVLARKLARLLPDLDAEQQGQIYRLTLEAIETLAQDQAVQVREMLAVTLRDVVCVPPSIASRLAQDAEQIVAEPLLHYCAALSDGDLLSIIARCPLPWALQAIAQRPSVSESISNAIYESGDVTATSMLLDNEGAVLSGQTLSRIAEDSAIHPEWQEPLARRSTLPPSIAVRLASFVDRSVLAILRARDDFDPETAADVVAVMRRRLDWQEARSSDEASAQRAARLHREGLLDETQISDALSWEDQEFVTAALALCAGIPHDIVQAIHQAQSPKGVTSLAWKAGLSMRGAMQLQAHWANIPPRQILNARGGTNYPLSEVEMLWQMEFYGAENGI